MLFEREAKIHTQDRLSSVLQFLV